MNPMSDALSLPGAADHGLSLLRLLGALGVVLVAFWLFARLMRQLNGAGNRSVAGLRVLGSLSLGQRERLVVLEADGERIVLGVTAQTVTRVHAMPAPPGETVPDHEPDAGLPAGPAFAARLRHALQRGPS